MVVRYCPQCGHEFPDGIQNCPDCKVNLADRLPPLSQRETEITGLRQNDPPVLAAKAPNEPIAVMWQGILENEGIRSVIQPAELKAAMYVPSLLAPCKLYVLASQADRAKEVLDPFINEQPDTNMESQAEPD
jgi:hypothetical protein